MRASWTLVLVLVACVHRAQAQPFFPPPAELVPLRDRSQEETDRLRGQALFIQGHIHQLRGQDAQALHRLKEAYFWDPRARAVLPDIITLAAALGRTDQAAEYAEVAIERGALTDPLLKRHVAALLSQEGRFESAWNLYNDLLQSDLRAADGEDAPPDAPSLLVRFDLGRLMLLSAEFVQAADTMLPVWTLLAQSEAEIDDPALVELRQQMLSQPQPVYELLWEVFLAARQCDRAEAVHQALQAIDPDDSRRLVRSARLAWCRGDRRETLALLEQYFTAPVPSPTPGARELLLDIHGLSTIGAGPGAEPTADQRQELIGRLEDWRRQAPESAELSLLLAEQLRRGGKVSKAAALYRERLKKQPDLEAYQGLVECLVASGDTAGLAELLLEVFGRVGDPQLLGPAWQTVVSHPQTIQQLLDQLRQPPAGGPEEADRAWSRATLRLLLAVELTPLPALSPLWRPVLASPDDRGPVFLVDIAGRLVELQEFTQAIELLTALAGKTKDELQPLVYYYLAGAWAEQADYDQAITAARQAVTAAAEGVRPLVQLRLGAILLEAQREGEAEELFQGIVQKGLAEDAQPEARQAAREARMLLSSIYARQGKTDEAEQLLVGVLLEHPQDIAAANDLAYLWADQSVRLPRAVGMLQKVVAAEPENVAYQDSLGWAYYRNGQLERARHHLRLACQGEYPDPLILDHLGDVLLAMEDRDGAARAWHRALEQLRERESPPELERQIRQKRERILANQQSTDSSNQFSERSR